MKEYEAKNNLTVAVKELAVAEQEYKAKKRAYRQAVKDYKEVLTEKERVPPLPLRKVSDNSKELPPLSLPEKS